MTTASAFLIPACGKNPPRWVCSFIYLLGRDQLNGSILIERNNGTTFTFTFNPALTEEV